MAGMGFLHVSNEVALCMYLIIPRKKKWTVLRPALFSPQSVDLGIPDAIYALEGRVIVTSLSDSERHKRQFPGNLLKTQASRTTVCSLTSCVLPRSYK